jgi:hypothetical protein
MLFVLAERHFRALTHSIRPDSLNGMVRSSFNSIGPERLRGVGNSSGDENGSDSMKYWELVADNLKKAGWSWGCVSAIGSNGRTIWIADAHRDNGKRFVVRAEEQLTALLELEATIRTCGKLP